MIERPAPSQSQKVRERIRNLQRKIIVAETKMAKYKKAERAADSHGKYLLGALTDIAGWEKLDLTEAERRIEHIAEAISSSSDLTEFQQHGDLLFYQHKQNNLGKKKPDLEVGLDWKAEVHYRITVGGMCIKHGIGAEKKSVILGAMALS